MQKIPLFILIIFLFSCNESNNNETEKIFDTDTTLTDSAEVKENVDLSGCYMRVTGRDTLLLRINQNGDDITGTLEFDNYQKDSSSGSLKGKKSADGLIHVYYDFFAEGMRSVREMYFKPGNKKLTMATGDMDYSGDTAIFKNAPQLFYSQSDALTLVDCEILDNRK